MSDEIEMKLMPPRSSKEERICSHCGKASHWKVLIVVASLDSELVNVAYKCAVCSAVNFREDITENEI